MSASQSDMVDRDATAPSTSDPEAGGAGGADSGVGVGDVGDVASAGSRRVLTSLVMDSPKVLLSKTPEQIAELARVLRKGGWIHAVSICAWRVGMCMVCVLTGQPRRERGGACVLGPSSVLRCFASQRP
jgi:hypothetical protein